MIKQKQEIKLYIYITNGIVKSLRLQIYDTDTVIGYSRSYFNTYGRYRGGYIWQSRSFGSMICIASQEILTSDIISAMLNSRYESCR